MIEKIQSVVIDSISKLGDMVWSLPVIGTFRPFGFLVGKGFKLSDAEEKEYKEVESKNEEAGKLDKELETLKKWKSEGKTKVGLFDSEVSGHGDIDELIRQKQAQSARLKDEAGRAADEI